MCLLQEGVRPGQRLLSISDPIRTNEDWEVGSGTSLSRVRDAIQFRRPATISFELTLASVEDDAGWRLEDAQQCAHPLFHPLLRRLPDLAQVYDKVSKEETVFLQEEA